MRESTAGSMQLTYMLEAMRKLGADPVALAASVGLPSATSEDTLVRIPSRQLLALLEAAARRLRDPLVGLHAGVLAESRGPLFYLLLSTPDLREGFRLFAQFARVPLDTQRFEVATEAGIVEMTIDPGDPVLNRSHHAVDYIVAVNLGALRRAIPGFRLLEVGLAHEEVAKPGETARTFGCPVRFGQARNTLRFPDSTLTRVPAGSNPTIGEQIRKFTEVLFDRVAARSVQGRVAYEVRTLLAAGLAAHRGTVAKRLGMSERTLQRQLDRESTSFQAVRDGVRLEVAQALLANPLLTVKTVAHAVGFAEVASFSRAFTRWAGGSPARFRVWRDGVRGPGGASSI